VAAAAAIVDAKPRSSRCSCGALGRHQNCYPPASESVKRKDPLEVEANMNRIMNNVVQELDGNTKNGRIGRFLANKFERINARECIPVHRGKARHHHHHHRRRRLNRRKARHKAASTWPLEWAGLLGRTRRYQVRHDLAGCSTILGCGSCCSSYSSSRHLCPKSRPQARSQCNRALRYYYHHRF